MDLPLGDRQKYYENLSSRKLMPYIPICARMDGRAFHTFTNGLTRPYDERLSGIMTKVTKALVEETGALIGYTQSDEISLIWYTEDPKTQLFFDLREQKMISILAATTTLYFNRFLAVDLPEKAYALPMFDARVWNVPNKPEAINYLMWREDDATKNSITMAAQHYYSHNELHGKRSSDKQELLWQKGVNWNDYPNFFKRGVYVQRKTSVRPFVADEIDKLPENHAARTNPNLMIERTDVEVLDLPPIRTIDNKEEVVFNGAEPILRTYQFAAGLE